MPKQKSKEREKKERSMAKFKFKKIAAIAMSAVLAVTSAPNLSLDFTATAKAAESSTFGSNTVSELSIDAGFSANTGDETISGNFDVQYTFTNKTKGSDNWNNFIIEVFDSNGGITDRADNYGWFYGTHLSDGSEHTWGDTDFTWEEFKESMKDASVSVDVSRRDKIVTISYTITDNADLSKVYSMKDTVTFTSLDDSVSMHITGEQVDLSDIKLVDKTDESSGSGTGSETKAFGENTADKLSVEEEVTIG